MKKIIISILTVFLFGIGVVQGVSANEQSSETKSTATVAFRQGAEIPDPNTSTGRPGSGGKLPQTGESSQLGLSLVGLLTVGAGGVLFQRRIKNILK